jgi:type II secretory pathway pseudopilin PulG
MNMKTTKHTPPPPRSRRAAAFTLVETVVATSITAVMVPAIYASLVAGFAMLQVTRENLRATQIIVQRMEAIRLSPYTLIQNPSSYPTNSTDYYCTNGKTNGVAYTVGYNCQPGPASLPPSYRTNMVLVTVNASWTSGKVQRTRSMQTYVAKNGIQRFVSSK